MSYNTWPDGYRHAMTHRKIKGYSELNQTQIDLMNEIKTMGVELEELVEKLKLTGAGGLPEDFAPDQRWISIGRTHLQQGLMALTRAIAKPEFF